MISAICSDPVVAQMIVHLCRNAVVMHRGTPTYFAMLSASLIITLIIINSRVSGEYILPVPGALCALWMLLAFARDLLFDLLRFPIVDRYLVIATMWGQVNLLWGQNVDVTSKFVGTVEKNVGDDLTCGHVVDNAHLLLGNPGLLS